MIILGKDGRLKFEKDRGSYAKEFQGIYDETQTYHDGKYRMFEPTDTSLFDDFIRLLRIKRLPNRRIEKEWDDFLFLPLLTGDKGRAAG